MQWKFQATEYSAAIKKNKVNTCVLTGKNVELKFLKLNLSFVKNKCGVCVYITCLTHTEKTTHPKWVKDVILGNLVGVGDGYWVNNFHFVLYALPYCNLLH